MLYRIRRERINRRHSNPQHNRCGRRAVRTGIDRGEGAVRNRLMSQAPRYSRYGCQASLVDHPGDGAHPQDPAYAFSHQFTQKSVTATFKRMDDIPVWSALSERLDLHRYSLGSRRTSVGACTTRGPPPVWKADLL